MGRAQVVQAQACRLEPDVRMNPILLKPSSDTGCQVIVRASPSETCEWREYVRYKPQAFDAARGGLRLAGRRVRRDRPRRGRLARRGEPEEPRHRQHADGRVRRHRRCWWSATSTAAACSPRSSARWKVLAAWERKQIVPAGLSSTASAATPACSVRRLDYTLAHTGRPVLRASCRICRTWAFPQEDSVEFKSGCPRSGSAGGDAAVEIAVIDLPHISNFTDFDAFRPSPTCGCGSSGRRRLGPPGRRDPSRQQEHARRSGMSSAAAGWPSGSPRPGRPGTRHEIVGICGGLQMLGGECLDPLGIESA